MGNNILKRLLLFSIASLTIFSCGDEDTNSSVVTSFEEYTVTAVSTPFTIDESVITEDADTLEFDFTLDDKQINNIHFTVGVGVSSTATEGVDFDLLTHDVELLAFGGQDGFGVEVIVYEDYDAELGDEEIYLTFTSVDPSGLVLSETKVITIEDSGLQKDLSFGLSWTFVSPEVLLGIDGTEPCDLNMDLTIQTQGSPPYGNDLAGFELESTRCPEEGRAFVSDMVDGEVYDLWVWIYGSVKDYGEFGLVNVYIDFSRLDSDFKGTLSLEEAFIYPFSGPTLGEGYIVGTIEKNGDVVTIKDGSGDIVGEGLMAAGRLRPTVIARDVIKPIF